MNKITLKTSLMKWSISKWSLLYKRNIKAVIELLVKQHLYVDIHGLNVSFLVPPITTKRYLHSLIVILSIEGRFCEEEIVRLDGWWQKTRWGASHGDFSWELWENESICDKCRITIGRCANGTSMISDCWYFNGHCH